MKILAAIVTYNRMKLLERCIDHVRAQTRPPDELLVINNSSPDATVDMLERKGVKYVTQPNLGSAGGWNRAIEAAIEGGFDAVWLMDDDGYPDSPALGHLEQVLVPGVACVSSVVLKEDRPEEFVFRFPVFDAKGEPVLVGRKRRYERLDEVVEVTEGDTFPFAFLFNGALIPTEVARRIGNVETRFFMMGDEVDYFMRLQKEGKVLSHLKARHLHPDVTSRPLDRVKFYYFIKNTIILNNRYFNRKALRNLFTVAVALQRTARRNSRSEALSYVLGRNRYVLWKAVRRGMKGQIGKDFDG